VFVASTIILPGLVLIIAALLRPKSLKKERRVLAQSRSFTPK